MPSSKTNSMTLDEVRTAVHAIPPSLHFVWNGVDEDDRPATTDEMKAGIEADRKRRGRPAGSGKGWQTRMKTPLLDQIALRSVGRCDGSGLSAYSLISENSFQPNTSATLLILRN